MGRTSLWVPVLAFQILMFFAKESLAIQCYKCSYDGTYCNDPFNPNLYGVTKCDGRSACIKTTTYDSGTQMTTRSC